MTDFAAQLLRWFDVHGRHDLPWQAQRSGYAVWVSEIMLQQTQVATVIPYYTRFMQRFVNIRDLADAPADDVLAHWAGLGYYARARNLHKAAQIICEEHAGEVPQTYEALIALPGIGRSTAGAILSIAFGKRFAILDGNVKRVLARRHAITQWPVLSAVQKQLWILAEQATPHARVADYTQAIMDLGATLCTRRSPRCSECPVRSDCIAQLTSQQAEIPARKPRQGKKPKRAVTLCILRNSHGEVLLERRPPAGIWGGLYSFPELLDEQDGKMGDTTLMRLLQRHRSSSEELATISHSFTHFDLDIRPIVINIESITDGVSESSDCLWYKPGSALPPGVPAPVSRLLDYLTSTS